MLSTTSDTRRAFDRSTAVNSNPTTASVLTPALKSAFDDSTLNTITTHRSFAAHSLANDHWRHDAEQWFKNDDPDASSASDLKNLNAEWSHLTIAPLLSPGTYSVQVTNDGNETNTTVAPLATTATGRSLTDADPISIASSPQAIVGAVSSAATDTYYRFALNTTSTLNLALSGLTADADLQLIQDANGNGSVDAGEVLASSYNPNTQSEAITTGLGAGTYFIHVYQYKGDTSYTLNAFATPLALPAGYQPTYGYGLVDAKAAIASAIGQPLTTVAPGSTSNAWDLNLVNAPTAWANGYTGQGIVVAVVDTGVDATHPDLNNNIWLNAGEIAGNGIDDDKNGFIDDVQGWDFVDRDNTPTDVNGHGTHVAGTIAAEQNDFGVTGVAYNAKVMPVRVIGLDGGSADNVAAGIRYAADNGADVINLSLGGGSSSTITNAIQYATQKGALVVMAAGNDGGSKPEFPANLANKWGLAVGAIDRNEKLAAFSDRAGASPLNYVVAPGVNIVSTTPNNTYQSFDGTSMATPHVAGVAALILSANPKLTPDQLKSIITASANAQGLTV